MIFDICHHRFRPQRPPTYMIWQKSVTLPENKNEEGTCRIKIICIGPPFAVRHRFEGENEDDGGVF